MSLKRASYCYITCSMQEQMTCLGGVLVFEVTLLNVFLEGVAKVSLFNWAEINRYVANKVMGNRHSAIIMVLELYSEVSSALQ